MHNFMNYLLIFSLTSFLSEIERKIDDSTPLILHWQKLKLNLIDSDCSAARETERRDKKSYPSRRTWGKLIYSGFGSRESAVNYRAYVYVSAYK